MQISYLRGGRMFGWGFERMKEEIFLGKRMEERIFDDSMMTIFVKVKKEIWTSRPTSFQF